MLLRALDVFLLSVYDVEWVVRRVNVRGVASTMPLSNRNVVFAWQ